MQGFCIAEASKRCRITHVCTCLLAYMRTHQPIGGPLTSLTLLRFVMLTQLVLSSTLPEGPGREADSPALHVAG